MSIANTTTIRVTQPKRNILINREVDPPVESEVLWTAFQVEIPNDDPERLWLPIQADVVDKDAPEEFGVQVRFPEGAAVYRVVWAPEYGSYKDAGFSPETPVPTTTAPAHPRVSVRKRR